MAIPLPVRRGVLAALLILAFVLQGTISVLAGTTGSISGVVTNSSTNAPITGASVTASSPSQTATAKTDASGHFTFISLAPDTYNVSVPAGERARCLRHLRRHGPSGPDATVTLTSAATLRTIGSTTARSASALVKPGTTVDVYSINPVSQDKASVMGGGGLLNSAWSAVTTVPGVYVAPGSAGYIGAGSGVSIRGGDYDQIGYELDGVPVNRSYDNYPSGKLSALGQQELQVYTGAAPVELRGPRHLRLHQPGHPHGNRAGVGQPRPGRRMRRPTTTRCRSRPAGRTRRARSRTTSGFGGYNEDYRAIRQVQRRFAEPLLGLTDRPCAGAVDRGVAPSCFSANGAPYSMSGYRTCADGTPAFALAPYNAAPFLSRDQERDNVLNLHFGIPQKSGNRDDVQFLWDSSGLQQLRLQLDNDLGGPAYLNAIGYGTPGYDDQYMLHRCAARRARLAGERRERHAARRSTRPRRAGVALGRDNRAQHGRLALVDQGIVKLQYQHNFGTSAFLRVYGYTYYSDWLENSPNSAYAYLNSFAAGVAGPLDYNVGSHTHGYSIQYSNQLNDKNLLTVRATTPRRPCTARMRRTSGSAPGRSTPCS